MLIGEKTKFGIEYWRLEEAPNQGYGKIWIDNIFIGSSCDHIYLSGYLLGTLHSMMQSKELAPELDSLTSEKLYELFTSGSYDKSDDYLVRSSTYTDDFSIWCYKKGDQTFVLWKLIRDSIFEDLKNYKKDLYLKSIKTKELNEAVEKLEASLQEIETLNKK